jgi:hypothetical protein
MKKSYIALGTVLIAGVIAVATVTAAWNKTFTPILAPNLWTQVNAPYETIANNTTHWTLTAGGQAASTHYARLRYGLPEYSQRVLTRFYLREDIRLSPTFCGDLTSGLRLMNTDNYGAILNGSRVGNTNGSEMRASVEMWTDKTIRIRLEHQSTKIVDLYISEPCPAFLSPGTWHTVELYGNLAAVEPWYFRVDGIVIAQGTAMLSTDTVPVAERIMTRAVWGLDGAWAQDTRPLSVDIRYIEIADDDPNGIVNIPTTPGATNTPQPNTATLTATKTATLTLTPPAPRTPTPSPATSQTATATPPATRTPECHWFVSIGNNICVP